MKLITVIDKMILAKLSQLEKCIHRMTPQNAMDQAIARAHAMPLKYLCFK